MVFHAAVHKHVPLMEDNPQDSCLSEEQLQGLKHLSTEADMAALLTRIKELIPAYTGWPRKGSERGNEAKPRKTMGELGGVEAA